MPDTRNYLVKNLKRAESRTGRVYSYLTRGGTPVAFTKEDASFIAESLGMDPGEAIELVPDDMVVILDSRARKLRQNPETLGLEQVTDGFQPA